MLIRGTCMKKDLMQTLHDAILSPGSNWTEVSSNKTNDFKYSGTISDGWIFKSPPIGSKQQPIYLTLKSQDFSTDNYNPTENNSNGQTGGNVSDGRNHIFTWLSEGYTPSDTPGTNGVHLNRGMFTPILISPYDPTFFRSTALIEYFVDVVDYRIIIVIQKVNLQATTYPNVIYIGYPNPQTMLEGPNYIHQFILASNLMMWGNPWGNCGAGFPRWYKNSAGSYYSWCKSSCAINAYNPVPTGQYILTPITLWADGLGAYSIPSTGMLGILDGLYGLPATNYVNGDIVKIGSDSYQLFNLGQYLAGGGGSNTAVQGLNSNFYYENTYTVTTVAIKV